MNTAFFKHFGAKRLSHKLVIFLVDDYGAGRIAPDAPENVDMRKLLDKSDNRFNRYDALASPADLEALFEVLESAKDSTGGPAVFTPLSIMANPDFERIREDGFETYYYRSFKDQLQQDANGKAIWKLWQEGMRHGIFLPEFHGREHVNVRMWLNYLRQEDPHILQAFNQASLGLKPFHKSPGDYLAAFDALDPSHLASQEDILRDGLKLFRSQYGYNPNLFTAPGLIHHNRLHKVLHQENVKWIDMARWRQMPDLKGGYSRRLHWMGQRNSLGQNYLTRNAMFEPNKDSRDWVNNCLRDIEQAFKYKQPAVISSHRVNFVGTRDIRNRDSGLKSLQLLLKQMLKKWPDLRFVSMPELTKSYAG